MIFSSNFVLALGALLSLAILAQGESVSAGEKTHAASKSSSQSHALESKVQKIIANTDVYIFELAEGGSHVVHMRNGKFKTELEDGGIIGCPVVSGVVRGKSIAVAPIIWSTGGTGCWEELALFEAAKGAYKCVGLYGLEDRAALHALSIKNGVIILDWNKHGPSDSAISPSVHDVLKLKTSDFQKCGK